MIIDLNSHILPKVDDGSKDIEISLNMARICLRNNITTVVATPHYVKGSMESDYGTNLRSLKKFNERLKEENIDLKLYLGTEAYLDQDIFTSLKNKKISTINNSRYLLIELPGIDNNSFHKDVLKKLVKYGYIPIIAHPETYIDVISNPNKVYELIEIGCLVQINIPSLEGRLGEAVRETAVKLLKHDMVHFIGSHAHSDIRRSPNISDGLEILRKLIGENYYLELVSINPQKVINNEDIEKREYKTIKEGFNIVDILKNMLN